MHVQACENLVHIRRDPPSLAMYTPPVDGATLEFLQEKAKEGKRFYIQQQERREREEKERQDKEARKQAKKEAKPELKEEDLNSDLQSYMDSGEKS